MDRYHLRPVDETDREEPPETCPAVGDLTPKMMGMVALMTMATFLLYGAIRLAGFGPQNSLLTMAYVTGAAAGAVYVLCLLRPKSYPWLIAMIASVSTFTGVCFAISHGHRNGMFMMIGCVALFVGFLTSLFRNIDDRVNFMPLVFSMLTSTSLILFCLS